VNSNTLSDILVQQVEPKAAHAWLVVACSFLHQLAGDTVASDTFQENQAVRTHLVHSLLGKRRSGCVAKLGSNLVEHSCTDHGRSYLARLHLQPQPCQGSWFDGQAAKTQMVGTNHVEHSGSAHGWAWLHSQPQPH